MRRCRGNILSSLKINKKVNIAAVKVMAVLMSMVMAFIAVGCSMSGNSNQQADGSDQRADTGFIVYGPDAYDSADTPVLVARDEEAGTMTFLNLSIGREYTLEYDGTTCFYDKYGGALTLGQIKIGEIVDVKFIKGKKHLTSMSIASSGWTIESTTRYVLDTVRRDVTIGEDVYNLSSDISFFSNDKAIEERDLIATDTLTFRGIGTSVYSVVVENGHGYLRITGQENFVGGWIEVGNKIIQRVTEDMILTVPEGEYQVKMSNNGTTSEKRVTIFRNSESKIDFSDVVFEDPKVGTVLFSVNPSNAELYIDGEKVDYSVAIELTYGLHQLICRATGYKSVTQYLNVGQASAGIDIVLEENDDSTGDTSDGNTSDDANSDDDGTNDSGDGNSDNGTDNNGSDANNSTDDGNGDSTNTDQGSTGSGTENSQTGEGNNETTDSGENGEGGASSSPITSYYQVHIDSPENVEVYVDGSYVGVSPCSFKKAEGSHIITLSKEGYITRSYTVYVDSEDRDVSFSFVELAPSN